MADPMIRLPGVGPVKRTWVYLGGAGLAGAVALAYYRRGTSSAPATIPGEVAAGDELLGYDPTATPGAGGLFEQEDGPQGSRGILTNQEWHEAASDYLIGQGYNQAAAGVALSKYVQNQTMTAGEIAMVRDAIGRVGQPPQGGPFAFREAPAAPVAAKPPAAPARVTAQSVGRASRPGRPGSHQARVTWTAVAGAKGYRVRQESPGEPHPWVDVGTATSWQGPVRLGGPRNIRTSYRVQALGPDGPTRFGGSRSSNVITVLF